ncbi:SPL family radical SAM protein [Clostridium sp. Marseille-P299]|uniref:SPL family radical SAM protein n=1 Tax=Clostridium sp. Marseille-P299 TaxID=1805477 RepID=UPI00083434C3|nr:DNA repair photolyase [Clostridium sp. Marseille-P299]
MNSYNQNLYSKTFSHIYIEDGLQDHPKANEIITKFPNAQIISISHYKDVFCRSKQNFYMQKQSPKLILANNRNNLIYEGAPVCQSFGNEHFYYTSCVMNCLYDCEYCYLQGMYSSANIVLFLNLDDIFAQVEELLKKHPVYLCISYDTDLLALEGILGYVRRWIEFTKLHPDLTIEIRTKSANFKAIKDILPSENVILAWTLSPDEVVTNYEHNTPSLQARMESILEAMKCGYRVRLCFDPLIYIQGFEEVYAAFIKNVFHTIPYEQLYDVSVGVFRVSIDYLKRMRKQRPHSAVIQYPYELTSGVSHYGHKRSNQMISYLCGLIRNYVPEDRIFCWEDEEGSSI